MTPDEVRKIIDEEVGHVSGQLHECEDKVSTLESRVDDLAAAAAHMSICLAVLAETIGLAKDGEFDEHRDAADELIAHVGGF